MKSQIVKPQIGDLFRRGIESYSYYLIVGRDNNSWIGLNLDDGHKYHINPTYGRWKKVG